MKERILVVLMIFVLSLCGCSKSVMVNQQEMVLISLYFPDKKTLCLTEEKRFVPKEEMSTIEEKISCVLKELRKGPENDALLCPFPKEGTMKLSRFSAHMAVVDFSSSFMEGHNGGSTSKFLSLYTITNSLTKIPEVNHVNFTVEGVQAETLKGHFDLTETFFYVDE